MLKNESILIERVKNGFIVSPNEQTGMTKLERDIHVFETVDGLKKFLDSHFGNGEAKAE